VLKILLVKNLDVWGIEEKHKAILHDTQLLVAPTLIPV
jgi:hypothetical protein